MGAVGSQWMRRSGEGEDDYLELTRGAQVKPPARFGRSLSLPNQASPYTSNNRPRSRSRFPDNNQKL
jgi:hypothetical protein